MAQVAPGSIPQARPWVDELRDAGLLVNNQDQVVFNQKGAAWVTAEDRDTRELVNVRVYSLHEDRPAKEACRNAMWLSTLAHPHIVQAQRLQRTPHFLLIVTEYANGGTLNRLIHDNRGGLPEDAARYLFQQVLLTVRFCHRLNIRIRNIDLENFLVFWKDGKPIVKIANLGFAKDVETEGAAHTPVVATMYTCPHMVRQAARGEEVWQDLAPVCDVWSAMVVLYRLLKGTFPFTRNEIMGWGGQPAAEWMLNEGLLTGLSPELADLFRGVFGGGGKEPDEYADDPECFSVERIITSDWFQKHLPGSGLAPLMAEQGSLNDDIKQRRSLLTQKLRAVQEATEEHAGQPMEGWLHLFNVQLEPPAESVFESGVPQAVWDAMPSPPQSPGAGSLDLWVTPDDDVAEPIRAYYPEICLDDLTKLTEAFVFP